MTENKITSLGNKWLMELWESNQPNDENPFFYQDEQLYMRYDSIRVVNRSKYDGGGVEVGYYWIGEKVCIFTVENVSLVFRGGNGLDLTGITGAMKMVVVEGP